MNLRQTISDDLSAIHKLHMAAFPNEENSLVAELACDLIKTSTEPATLSLVAENDDNLLGHIVFSPVTFSEAKHLSGYILAPVGVSPEAQKQGVGSALIKAGLAELQNEDVQIVLVYGDPAYYGRFGFKEKTARAFAAPYPLEFPFGWQAQILNSLPEPDINSPIQCVPALNKEILW